MGTLTQAIMIAAEAHDGQVDKNGEPYILHVLRVVTGVQSPVARIVAALHDTVEDAPDEVSLDRISRHFGSQIANAVDALTRREAETYNAYLDRVAQNERAREVKLADLKDNMRPCSSPDARRLRRRYEDAHARLCGFAPAVM